MKRHAATLWAADFVSVRTLTACGVVELYLVFFIHIGSRRAIASAPDGQPRLGLSIPTGSQCFHADAGLEPHGHAPDH